MALTNETELSNLLDKYLDGKIYPKQILFLYGERDKGLSQVTKFLENKCSQQSLSSVVYDCERTTIDDRDNPKNPFYGPLMFRHNLANVDRYFTFPLYDFACFWYLHKQGRSPEEIKKLFPSEVGSLIAVLVDIVSPFLTIPPVGSISKSILDVRDRYANSQRQISLYLKRLKLEKDKADDICRLTDEDLINSLPRLFADDLNKAIKCPRSRIILIFNNYINLANNRQKEWLWDLLAQLNLSTGIVVVVVGQKLPNWDDNSWPISQDKLDRSEVSLSPQAIKELTQIITKPQFTQPEKGKAKMDELKITMFGARGVGKTSALAAMYGEIKNKYANGDVIKIEPIGIEKHTIETRLQELQELATDPKPENEMNPTLVTRHFEFKCVSCQKQWNLSFKDYPGENLDQNPQEVEEYIRQSSVVIIPIDSFAMMYDAGRLHDQRNKVKEITDIFETVYQNVTEPRLVIFAPVKCESYISTIQQDLENDPLKKKFIDRYSWFRLRQNNQNYYKDLILNFLKGVLKNTERIEHQNEQERREEEERIKLRQENIAIVFIPVLTLGSSIIKSINSRGNDIVYDYYTREEAERNGIHLRYKPEGGDQIIKYILRFWLQLNRERKNHRAWYEKMTEAVKSALFSPIEKMFQDNTVLEREVDAWIRENEKIDNWAIIQGHRWLGRNFSKPSR